MLAQLGDGVVERAAQLVGNTSGGQVQQLGQALTSDGRAARYKTKTPQPDRPGRFYASLPSGSRAGGRCQAQIRPPAEKQ